MNFLAHLWLADRSGTSLAGSVLGDVVRGADLSAYPEDIATGVRLHRRIDAATDRHPGIVALRAGFPEGTRRYAGIVLDLIGDHALALDWARHHPAELPAFCAQAGSAIAEAGPWFRRAGGRDTSAAAFARLLESYGEAPGIDHALARTAQRLRDPAPLLAAGQDWPRHLPSMRALLPELLDDLLRLAP